MFDNQNITFILGLIVIGLIIYSSYCSYINRKKIDRDLVINLITGVLIASILLFLNYRVANIEKGIPVKNANGEIFYIPNVDIPKEEKKEK